MPVEYVAGDPLATSAQTLAFGFNARGQIEMNPLATRLYDQFPAAFATFRKQCRSGRIKPGMLWIWSESQPRLLFMVVRESAVGMTRLRFVENALMTLARDYLLYGVESLALVPMGDEGEWTALRPVVDYWMGMSSLPVQVLTAG
ncbi:MAG: hypothetical protein J0L63_19350 [Anaerolineae bacterium]|nr:hypothetical protein [Anaerolineae bacterium]